MLYFFVLARQARTVVGDRLTDMELRPVGTIGTLRFKHRNRSFERSPTVALRPRYTAGGDIKGD